METKLNIITHEYPVKGHSVSQVFILTRFVCYKVKHLQRHIASLADSSCFWLNSSSICWDTVSKLGCCEIMWIISYQDTSKWIMHNRFELSSLYLLLFSSFRPRRLHLGIRDAILDVSSISRCACMVNLSEYFRLKITLIHEFSRLFYLVSIISHILRSTEKTRVIKRHFTLRRAPQCVSTQCKLHSASLLNGARENNSSKNSWK